MKVRSLCRREVLSAGPGETLAEAASRMQYDEVGALVVLDGGTLVGIITERDLVRAMADGVDPADTPVASYMTPDPVTIDLDADAAEAAEAMVGVGARHLPVVEAGRVVGMISARDLIELGARRVRRPG